MDTRKHSMHRLALMALCSWALVLGCVFEVPDDPPVWVVNLVIPLINKSYTVREMIEDAEIDEVFIDEPNEQIVLDYSDDADVDFSSLLEIGIPESDREYPADAYQRDSMAISGGGILVSREAVIDSGRMRVTVENPNAYPIHAVFDVPDLWYPGLGGTFTSDWELGAFDSQTRSFPVDDHVLRMAAWDDVNYLRYAVGGNGHPGDRIRVRYEFGDIAFRSITGTYNEVEASFEDVEIESPVPDELKEFRIQAADLTIRFTAGIRLPVEIHFEISGEDFHGPPSAPITIDTALAAWDGIGEPPEYTFTREIADFINSMPEKILFSGTAKVGRGGVEATISIDDPIGGELQVRAPFILAMPSYTSKMDVDTLDLDEDTRDAVRDNLMGLRIAADIENYLPVSTTATIFYSAGRGDSTLYDFPDITVGPVVLAPATLAGDPGVVTEPGVSQWNQTFTKQDEIALFEEETLYWGIRFDFDGTGGMAKIRPSDYVKVRAHAEVEVRTKVPEDDHGEGGGS